MMRESILTGFHKARNYTMTNEEAKEIFLNRGFVNGLFDGDKWRQSIVVISKWLEQDTVPFDFELYQAGLMDMPKGMVEVLNEIRTEIEQYKRETQDIDLYDLVGDCLAIFDKYMPESEKV